MIVDVQGFLHLSEEGKGFQGYLSILEDAAPHCIQQNLAVTIPRLQPTKYILGGRTGIVFNLQNQFEGSFSLAMALMFFMGIFNSIYMISIQSSLQIMVPDRMRGRVMGFYGMTWSIMPLGGLQASALTSVLTAPIAIAIGGLAVALFALGPAAINPKVRSLGNNLSPV